jgi:hypothetical protein
MGQAHTKELIPIKPCYFLHTPLCVLYLLQHGIKVLMKTATKVIRDKFMRSCQSLIQRKLQECLLNFFTQMKDIPTYLTWV